MLTTFGCNRNSGESQTNASIVDKQATVPKKDGQLLFSPKKTDDQTPPVVLIDTSLGEITVRLNQEESPLSVANFLAYVDAGSYDQTIFHQIYSKQAILAGGFTVNNRKIPARAPIRSEADNGLKNLRGAVAVFRQADDTNSAATQFFINVADNPSFDHTQRTAAGYGYCVFGKVISGMNVVDAIAAVPLHETEQFDQTPIHPVVIKSIRRIK
ncbi:MAG: peptidylprolyl isomerase [Thermoguttaceae bacterium]